MEETLILLGKLLGSTVAIVGVVFAIVSAMLRAHNARFEKLAEEMKQANAAQSAQWRGELQEARAEHTDLRFQIDTAKNVSMDTKERQAVLDARFKGYEERQVWIDAKLDALHKRLDEDRLRLAQDARDLAKTLGEWTGALHALRDEVHSMRDAKHGVLRQ